MGLRARRCWNFRKINENAILATIEEKSPAPPGVRLASALSKRGQPIFFSHAARAGFQDYLEKPAIRGELIAPDCVFASSGFVH
jgi:hypothetical protein